MSVDIVYASSQHLVKNVWVNDFIQLSSLESK